MKNPGDLLNAMVKSLRAVVFAIVVGTLVAFIAIGFVDGAFWLNDILNLTTNRSATISWWLILVPTGGGLLVGLLVKYIPEQIPHNPAEVIQAAHQDQPMPTKSGLLTAVAAFIGLGAGASVGQYGPLVHIGATLASIIKKCARVEPIVALGCGVAAAIATAFSAPIAGIIFAHEAILRKYSPRAFAPITVAAVTGMFIGTQVFDRRAWFEIEFDRAVGLSEFLSFILIGIGGALLAVVFMHAILFMRRTADRLPLPVYIKPCIAGLGIGLSAHWIPEIIGSGGDILRLAITPDVYSNAKLISILAAKLIATALCLGFGFAGGVFNPALLLGVLFGASLADTAAIFSGDTQTLSLYATCAMAAVVSPVIGAPLTTILIVFELTRNYALTTAVMVSIPFANLVGYRLFGRSLFDRQLLLRGFVLERFSK